MLDIQRESAYAGLKDTTTHPIVPPTINEKTMTGADNPSNNSTGQQLFCRSSSEGYLPILATKWPSASESFHTRVIPFSG